MIPLVVTARMATGIAHASPWTPALDGILAAELWHETKRHNPPATPALDADDPPDLDLPLARCTPTHGPWHWAATCAWPDPVPATPEIHTWTGRVDHRALEHLATTLPKIISDRQGRYRARCMPLMVTTCRTLTWHAIGDPEAVSEILSGVRAIGKKRSQGEGVVLEWNVAPSDLDAFTAAHLYPTGRLGRPTPPGCLTTRPDLKEASALGYAGVRPPHMHPSRFHDLHLPAPITVDDR